MFKVNPSWLGLLATGAVFHLESSGVVDESDIVRQEMIPVRKTEKLPSYFPHNREVVKHVSTLNIN